MREGILLTDADDPILEDAKEEYKKNILPRIAEIVNRLNEIQDDHIRHKILATAVNDLLSDARLCGIEVLGVLELVKAGVVDKK